MIPVVAVVGPTASGKTALALEIARRLDTEILSADSMQFYRGMEIGTAAPTEEERSAIPHHFVGFLQPQERMDAAAYEKLARGEVLRLNARGRTAVVAGGSGLYVAALIDGIFQGPGRQESVRERLNQEAAEFGNLHLLRRLQAVDPEYAAALTSENDLVRIVRALEVYELTGAPFSQLHAAHRAQAEPLDALQVALDWPRETLYARINQRVEQMLAAGWIQEVERLLEQGHEQELFRLKALGYREIIRYLKGEQSLDAALALTQQHHRRYAKRQISWFKGDARVHWLPPEEALAERVLALMP